MNEAAMQAVALWVGLNIGLTFLLAMNVVRYRRMGETADPARLEGAIRAHGNNTEYVPVILLGMAMLAAMGVSVNSIHILGGGLLVFGYCMPMACNVRACLYRACWECRHLDCDVGSRYRLGQQGSAALNQLDYGAVCLMPLKM